MAEEIFRISAASEMSLVMLDVVWMNSTYIPPLIHPLHRLNLFLLYQELKDSSPETICSLKRQNSFPYDGKMNAVVQYGSATIRLEKKEQIISNVNFLLVRNTTTL